MTARTPEGPGSLRITRAKEGLVGAAWGEGAAWLLDRLGSIAGLDDHPASFVTEDPVVSPLHHRHPGMRFGRTDRVFDALVTAICAQKVTGAEAMAASAGLRRAFSETGPGPRAGLRLPPDPERMAAAPYWDYHELRLERRRAETLRRVAADHDAIERLGGMPVDRAAASLAAYPGIGPWTVAKTLTVSHGDADQVEVGDFHVKHIVVHHLTGRPRGTDEEMLELLEPFRPHRGRVVRLLHTLGHEPKFGPRVRARDFTRS
jgi:3-methyladenine DNA glycosylase/8-oxoguanine DNA glycosylase